MGETRGKETLRKLNEPVVA